MNRPVSLHSFLSNYPSERGDRAIRPRALCPLFLVVAIAVFVVWASGGTSKPDQHMTAPSLQARMAP